MDEREDPGARLAPLGHEARRCPPEGEERVLDRILGERLVAEHAQREPVRRAAVAVVELGERRLLGSGRERDERLVGKVRELPRHVRHSYTRRLWFMRPPADSGRTPR